MKNKKYRSLNRSTTRIRYHIVLAFKYHYKIARIIGEENMKRVITSTVAHCDGVKLLAIGIDKYHVHLIVSSPPYWSISRLVSRIKQLSTHKAWGKYSHILEGSYYKKKVLFSDGYFCETIGSISEDEIIDYVLNQGV